MQTTFVSTVSSHTFRLISYCSIPLLIYKIFLLDKFSNKERIVIILVLLSSLITWRVAYNSDLLLLFPLVFGAKGIKFKKLSNGTCILIFP